MTKAPPLHSAAVAVESSATASTVIGSVMFTAGGFAATAAQRLVARSATKEGVVVTVLVSAVLVAVLVSLTFSYA